MSNPIALKKLRSQREAFLKALTAAPSMSAFASLLRDLVDDRSPREKNEELIRDAVGVLPKNQPLSHITAIVMRRLEMSGNSKNRKTVQRVLRAL